jgi:hypothetical protein
LGPENVRRQAGTRWGLRRDDIAGVVGDGSRATPPDRATLRPAAIVGVLLVALIAGFGLGWAADVSRLAANAPNSSGSAGAAGHAHAPGTASDHPHGAAASADSRVGGLAVSSGGYTFALASTTMTAGTPTPFRFRIDGPDRRPVTAFAVAGDKLMHLIVVRRDLTGYQHLHPTMSGDGTWHVELALPAPGIWRLYADFLTVTAAGAQMALTLGADLTVAGEYAPVPVPAAARQSTVDGYTVRYEGTPHVGATQPLVFRVFKAGTPVPDLERYLGAYGHLVALREGDLAYIHVHPEDRLFRGAAKLWLSAPSKGRYRMFFEFQVGGTVYIAPYTVVVS